MAAGDQEQQNDSLLRRYVPPWREPYVIAMAGSSGSGKTSIAQSIIKELNVSSCSNGLRLNAAGTRTNLLGALDYSSFDG